jgi:NAD(P)-dependent dehydrogenase (short-subunit alcohol dehydrogenase family)
MENSFNKKVALVTGGSYGIGRATALAFAAQGATVVIADWEDGSETLDLIKKNGGTGIFIQCDVSNVEQVNQLMETIEKNYGGLDFAINNAGIEGHSSPIDSCTLENWHHVLNVNLTGTFLCMKGEIPMMLKQGAGVIINIASVAGLVGFEGIPAYVASKHAIVGLTKNAALDYATKGIRVNAICPGVVRTPMIDRFTGKDKAIEAQFAKVQPVGRLGEPEEIADAVLWLCGKGGSFVTGAAIPVDGGWVAK